MIIFQEYFRGGSALGGAGAQQRVFWNWEVRNCGIMKCEIC